MSDTTATPVAADPGTGTAAEPTEPTPATTPQEPDWKAEAEKWKSFSRQNEAQAKANAEKAREFDALQEANKTELQKAQEAAEAATQRALAAEQRAMKAEIARTRNVPLSALDKIVGSTEDELIAALDELGSAFAAQKPVPAVGGVGVNGSAAPVIYTPEQIRDPQFYTTHRDEILAALREPGAPRIIRRG